MLQLTGTEATLIRQEGKRQPQHISLLLMYDPSTAPLKTVLYREILAALQHSLPAADMFRRKLVTAPLNLRLPYWTEGNHFDFEYHVRHIALPRPGNRAQLSKLLARLHGVPLDLNRPLWEVYVIEGLTGLDDHGAASFALLFKLHLAAVEQLDIQALLEAIHTAAPESDDATRPDDRQPEPAPPLWQILSRADGDGVRGPGRLLRAAAGAIGQWRWPLPGRGDAGARARPGPTRFNAPISGERVVGGIDIDRSALSAIAQALPGLSADEVLAGIVGGALRHYLQDKGELPADSLAAAVPVQVPHAGPSAARIGLIRLSLGTCIDNPIERLDHIHCAAGRARAELRALAARQRTGQGSDGTPAGAPEQPPEDAAAPPFCYLRDAVARAPLPFDVFLSRLHGPRPPSYFSGAALQSVVAMGSVMDQIGLSHTATSGCQRTSIAFVACRAMLPDPEFYSACLTDSLRRLQRSVVSLRGA